MYVPWANNFELFLHAIPKCPSDFHTIDRVNNRVGYFPGNLRWATTAEQSRNTSRNLYVKGEVLIDYAKRVGIPYNTLRDWYHAGRLNKEIAMPYVNKPRPYKKEYEQYHSKPEQMKRRAERNAARRKMEAAGKVYKGDGKDVDHVRALSKGGTNRTTNLRVRAAGSNRSYSRNSDHTMKRNAPKK
jgi:Zn-finger nucleic acid-binding protein